MGERRVCSSIDRLPGPIREQVDQLLMSRTNSYTEIAEWLQAEGHEISRSAVWRYARRFKEAVDRMSDALQRTQSLISAVEAHPDLDYTKAANVVLMDGLMQKVVSAEDEFLEMPLEKAGRLIASLSRNATYEKRTRQDMKKKTELAFDAMEAELLAKIKQDPALAGELHDILTRAREKVVTDGD